MQVRETGTSCDIQRLLVGVHGSFSLVFPSSQVPITMVRGYLVGGVQRSSGKDGIPGDWDEGKLLTEAIWWLLGFDMS